MSYKYTFDNSPIPNLKLDTDLQELNPVCIDILYRRGYRTNEDIRNILFPDATQALKPLNCKDIQVALNIMRNAIKENIPIVVYHDYDVDGITAGAVAVSALQKLGVTVNHYANSRKDGFGICVNGINNILNKWPETGLIITVDNGISGIDGVAYAKDHGLQVIVTDHHEPNAILPAADAVIDLKRMDETYPYKDYCGCGLIFRIMLDLYRKMNKDIKPILEMLDMVALATVADVVPLIGDNRYYVKEGLKLIEEAQRPFFRMLAAICDVNEFTAHNTLAYKYAPILNSLSRMNKDTGIAIDILVSDDIEWVAAETLKLKQLNDTRKEFTQTQKELALSKVTETNPASLVVYDESFSEGVVGIISGQLKDLYHCPVIVFAKTKDGILKGSGRSLGKFNLKAALDKLSYLLLGYGGHAKAAGLSIRIEQLNTFIKEFNALTAQYVNTYKDDLIMPLAAILNENTLTTELVKDLRILEPYGEGFPEPVFGLNLNCDIVQYMGSEQQHVKLTNSTSNISVIVWNKGNVMKTRTTIPNKFVGKPSLNIWNGEVKLQFIHDAA